MSCGFVYDVSPYRILYNEALIMIIKLEAKYRFYVAAILLFYILNKITVTNIFSGDPLQHNTPELWKS
jgi:hypothetical protein